MRAPKRSRLTQALAATALGALAVLLMPGAASAETPVSLGSSDVYDSAGVVSDEAAILDAFDALYDETGIQLVVVYVDTFENPSDAYD